MGVSLTLQRPIDAIDPTTRASRPLGDWVVAGLVAFYVVLTLPMVTAPVGLSHDGQNTGVFALGARALRQLGWSSSNFGASLAQGNGTYAHHPPSIVWATALSESILGTHPWSSRLPTYLGSIAVIVLLYRLARVLGLDSISAAVGTCVAVGNPMFFTYAWMLDTPMWSLPFALALLIRWIRSSATSSKPRDWALTGGLATMCALSGWEATLMCGVFVAVTAFQRSKGPTRFRSVAPIVVGTAFGFAVTMAWIAASPEGVAGLMDSFVARTGESAHAVSPSIGDSITAQYQWTTDVWLVPVLVMVPAMAVAAWRDRRTRLVSAVSGGLVAMYGVLFWQAASIHDYWHFWAIVPITIGAGALACRLRTRMPGLVVTAALLAVALAAPVWTATGRSHSQTELRAGWDVANLIARTPLASGQDHIVLGGLGQPWSWASYANSLDMEGLVGRGDLRRLNAEHPEWMMVLGCWTIPSTCAQLRRDGAPHTGPIVIAPVGRVLDAISAHDPTSATSSQQPR